MYNTWRQLAQFTLISIQVFFIRGKLERSVPVLLDYEMKTCIDLLLQYRKEANIPEKNPYVFALPGYDKMRFRYIRACTKFRKHIATRCIILNLSEHEVIQLVSYLGHDKSIHTQHYRQPIPQIEIIKMSRLLKIAQDEDYSNEQDAEQDNLQINEEKDSFIINEKNIPRESR
ncbi:hypothetical protein P5V15_014349 [Pogonomyrmex californicus]